MEHEVTGDYRERVWPSAWVWLLSTSLGASLAIAYGAAYGAQVGLMVLVPALALPLAGLAISAPC